jgi:hypothetical protein
MAKVANTRAARLTGLTVTTIECLRWRKVKRIPADVADAVREAKARHDARIEALARHDAELLDLVGAQRPNTPRVGARQGVASTRSRGPSGRALALG